MYYNNDMKFKDHKLPNQPQPVQTSQNRRFCLIKIERRCRTLLEGVWFLVSLFVYAFVVSHVKWYYLLDSANTHTKFSC